MKTKKVFLSYSTEFPEHQEWVIALGDQLSKHGIDNTIDVHELKLGQDMYAFMERIISPEYDHVIILSDSSYVRKANARLGGVGAEVQLLTQQVYNAINQTRVIPVFTEWDEQGEPTLPIFLKGRFALDFTNPENYGQQYAKLCLAILGESIYDKKALGKPLDVNRLKEAAKGKSSSPPKNKNINKGNLEDVEEVHIGDSNASPEAEEYQNKNIQEGNIKKVKKFRLGDDYQH